MKTNAAARQIWNLRLRIAGLVLAVIAASGLWAVDHSHRQLAKIAMQQTSPPPVWSGSITGSELFAGGR